MSGAKEVSRLLHVKLRVLVLEPMSDTEALQLVRRAVRTGVIPRGIDLAWIDWARPRDMMSPPVVASGAPLDTTTEEGRRYLGEKARAALVDFLGAIKHHDSAVLMPAVAPPEREPKPGRVPHADVRTVRRPSRSSMAVYHATLRRARRLLGFSYPEARALYREMRAFLGRPVFPADVDGYYELAGREPDALPSTSALFEPEVEVGTSEEPAGPRELELTARTYRKLAPRWRLEVVDEG